MHTNINAYQSGYLPVNTYGHLRVNTGKQIRSRRNESKHEKIFKFQLTGSIEDGGSDFGGAVLLYSKSTFD